VAINGWVLPSGNNCRLAPLTCSKAPVLKGMEVPLPGGAWFEGKDGHPRYHARLRWWHQLRGEHPLTWLGLVKVGVDVEAALVKALKGIPASP